MRFSRTLRQFETYLDLIEWIREYVTYYADISKALQIRKIVLLKSTSKAESARKSYFSRTHLLDSIFRELELFRLFQKTLFKSIYLIHHDLDRQLYVNLDASKKFEFEAIIYHVAEDKVKFEYYLSRFVIKSMLFLSRLLNSTKTRYWLIELEFADVVWVLKKIKYLIESFILLIVIYTDHDAALNIVK